MSLTPPEPAELLSAQGPLARRLPGFAPREAQQRMAEAVADALAAGENLVVEAGTGTGKTFAYLVPALLCGRKVIVSTGTRHLQDQLFHRDLPLVREALGTGVDVALLKGRANYLCLHRLELAEAEGLSARRQARELQAIRRWSGSTADGDIAGIGGVPEDAAIWPRVTSTSDNCLGGECPRHADCFVVKARRRAQEADLVVVNHHLLFADMALKEEGFGELLPEAGAFIVDEAHQLAETASAFFGLSLGSRQLLGLARDAVLEHLAEAGDMAALPDSARALETAVADLRLAFGRDSGRRPWQAVQSVPEVQAALQRLGEMLDELTAWLEAAAPRGRGLEAVWHRAQGLQERLRLVREAPPAGYVQWLETFRRSFGIHFTPLDIAAIFREQQQHLEGSWVFTSATLAVGDSFEHFTAQLGLEAPRTLRLDSPFDYVRNTLLYLPPGLPAPNQPAYNAAVTEVARQLLPLSRGRAFLLFTSHRALRQAAEALRDSLDYPLLVQGEAPRSELLRRFRELGDAVLLGTGSFWEGVDVRGEALSLVLIDKLPFASPGDPVLQARLDLLREQGGNPFMDYQLPGAVIALKQGVGRLIRDVSDRGVLVLCDPRLLDKPYGRLFRASLPPMPQSRRLEDVAAFFAGPGTAEAAAGGGT
ncbi:ATP-dependent DNA helicase [Thiohalobacter sp. IOR34]|uniref:ATP-dependent DNA helicase n=1 Tax=Thiohalobacter sp. IOR34 TaxID=3057176 RepID=UPI0025B0A020|nr:ATP-dependent DNA helicase [Thiohalobacter sp. IOR34]WJW76539.1 ATP-dependent DNA helicase [Thiohalobacter sp. IOR34]